MPAQIICAPSWGYTFVKNRTSPSQLGMALIELIRRNGQDDVSDMLDSEKDWDFIDPDIAEDALEEESFVRFHPGYGPIVVGSAIGRDDDIDFVYGILTTGTLMITDCASRDFIAINPFAENAEDKLEEFCSLLGITWIDESEAGDSEPVQMSTN